MITLSVITMDVGGYAGRRIAEPYAVVRESAAACLEHERSCLAGAEAPAKNMPGRVRGA
jgi:hypothetical protein